MKIKTENKYYVLESPQIVNIKFYFKRLYYIATNILFRFIFLFTHNAEMNKTYNVSICAIFKNEAKYLKEWIEYHLIIGVDHFYLFNNFSEDEFRKVLQPYVEAKKVTLIDWPVKQGQMSAYRYCIKQFSGETDWIAFIDIDEFIVPVIDDNIKCFLKRFRNRPSVKLNWNVFGSSGIINRDIRRPVIEDFTVCWRKIDEVGKCIYNTHFDINLDDKHNSNLHHSLWGKLKGLSVPPVNCFGHICRSGFEHADSQDFPIIINHYFTKSVQEYIEKSGKGDVYFKNNPHNMDYFYAHEHKCGKNDYSIYKYLVDLKLKLKMDK